MLENSLVQVAVENTSISFDKTFDYLVPSNLQNKVFIGSRVLVPFGRGNKKRQGFVFNISVNNKSKDDLKLKTILAVLDEAPLLNLEMCKLCFWLQEKTFCTLFEAAKAMIPPGLSMQIVETFIISPDCNPKIVDDLSADEKLVYDLLIKRGTYVKKDRIIKNLALDKDTDVFETLINKGIILKTANAEQMVGDASQKMVELLLSDRETEDILPKLTLKQRAVVNVLLETGSAEIKELCYLSGVTPAVITTLHKKSIVLIYHKPIFRSPRSNYDLDAKVEDIILSDDQEACFQDLKKDLNSGVFNTSLLYGVTGSGKTSVYLKLIDEIIDDDGGIIVMVPEIALTPQTLAIFYSRYKDKVAVFHSGLTIGERMDEWKRVKSGDAKIAVGTRSAVFAPFEKLSLIIIDEEQEHTYKSEKSPRYHARDVARFRCAYNKALLVLASATPSVTTYAQALAGKYNLCKLTKRYGKANLPEVVVVDMTDREKSPSSISGTLQDLLRENLEASNQSILLLNRRGHNTFVSCTSCKNVISCPHCSISLVFHSPNNRLMCHYCGYSRAYQQSCPECFANTLRYSGFGTQRIEEELYHLFPDARILRMDADTTMSRYAYDEKFADFAKGKYDIMLGTQMVAKGLDFPNVTLVGVVSVDQQLYNDDYLSMERTFDLLTQVLGRSGRGDKAGVAVLQTMMPDNEIIRLAADQDFESFYKTEIALRRAMIYPPFCDLCLLIFAGEDEALVKSAALWFFDLLKSLNKTDYADQKLIVLGPLPLRVVKISNKYRYRLIIKCKDTSRFRDFIRRLLNDFTKERRFSKVLAIADINPERTN